MNNTTIPIWEVIVVFRTTTGVDSRSKRYFIEPLADDIAEFLDTFLPDRYVTSIVVKKYTASIAEVTEDVS